MTIIKDYVVPTAEALPVQNVWLESSPPVNPGGDGGGGTIVIPPTADDDDTELVGSARALEEYWQE